MRVVAALGGNALLRRGERPSAANQRRNIRLAAEALGPVAGVHELVITHGSGPQVGLLALQSVSGSPGEGDPLDILDAEAEGQIGYLIEQEMRNILGPRKQCVTLLTQIEVDPDDPAFGRPTKPIGPFYGQREALELEKSRGWVFARDRERYRRVVASPRPKRILAIGVIEMLVERGVVTICAGGGGIPAIMTEQGRLVGAEAVIDKDFASALLAREMKADALLMLTDVDGVYARWGEPEARRIRRASPDAVRRLSFAPGSMGPKVEAACEFVEATGGIAGIGALEDASAILGGMAGTTITKEATEIEYWE